RWQRRPGRLGCRLSVRAPCNEESSAPSNPDLWSFRRRSVESFVNDLRMGRGVVLGRAVSTLRSVETHPLTLDSSKHFFFSCGLDCLALKKQQAERWLQVGRSSCARNQEDRHWGLGAPLAVMACGARSSLLV